MRVLIAQPSCHVYGGAELAIVKLCSYLTKQGYEVGLITNMIIPDIEKDVKARLFVTNSMNFEIMHRWILKHIDEWDIINTHNRPCELFTHPSNKLNVWYHNEPPEYVLYGQP